MRKTNTRSRSDLLDYAQSILSLTPEQRALMESTDALRGLSHGQMALVLDAFYGD